MTIERKNPIPKGVYWIDTFNALKGTLRFNRWAKEHAKTITVLRREKRASDSWDPDRYHEWILFEVVEPTKRWKNVDWRLVLPTVAKKKGIDTRRRDTVQRPKEQTVPEYWKNQAREMALGSTLSFGVILFILGLANSNRRK